MTEKRLPGKSIKLHRLKMLIRISEASTLRIYLNQELPQFQTGVSGIRERNDMPDIAAGEKDPKEFGYFLVAFPLVWAIMDLKRSAK